MAKVEWVHSVSIPRPCAWPVPGPEGPKTCMEFPDGWYLHGGWGHHEADRIAGPFPTLDVCKAAFILMWGTN